MPLLYLKVGQPVFIIEDNNIYEANITKIFDKKRVEVIADDIYKTIKTYDVDWFLTRKKAEKVLAGILEIERRKEREMQLATQEDKDPFHDDFYDCDLKEFTCVDCEFGEELDYSQQLQTGKQLLCRKYWRPVMGNENKNCTYFKVQELLPIKIYYGGSFSPK
ncbi:hypothetical protein ACFYKT_18250 [Cytobacillus sp. FJAT-53684]|uniref:Uncharacterized protein n=1 Tax=Cytobacillus mangrovibacter TaxID=3299024 RepID=A0ABW6K5M5_9BACI